MSEIFLDRLTGHVFGKYKVLERLGKGGMSFVYKGMHLELGLPVAMKFPFLRFSQVPENRQRFLREARVQFHLKHNNLVRVIDLIDQDEILGMVMDWIEGTDLEKHMKKRGLLSFEEIARLFLPVIEVVGYAHRKEIIHRDLKPANILLESTFEGYLPKVMDFGIAKFAGTEHPAQAGLEITKTVNNAVIGTPAYFSPEQATGQPIDYRTDIYSLGVIFFQMLTGRLPFSGQNLLDMISAHYKNPPPPLASFRPELDPRFQTILDLALAKNRQDRYPDCAAFARDIRYLLSQIEPNLVRSGSLPPSSLPLSSENYAGTTPDVPGIPLSAAPLSTAPQPPSSFPHASAFLPAFSPSPALSSPHPNSPQGLPSGSSPAKLPPNQRPWPLLLGLTTCLALASFFGVRFLSSSSAPPSTPSSLSLLSKKGPDSPPSSPSLSDSREAPRRPSPPPDASLSFQGRSSSPSFPLAPNKEPPPPDAPSPSKAAISPQQASSPKERGRRPPSERRLRTSPPKRPSKRPGSPQRITSPQTSVDAAHCKQCVFALQTKININLQMEDVGSRTLCTIDGVTSAAQGCAQDCGGSLETFRQIWLTFPFQNHEGHTRPARSIDACKRLLQTRSFLEKIRPLYPR